jgi:hypothetical protein
MLFYIKAPSALNFAPLRLSVNQGPQKTTIFGNHWIIFVVMSKCRHHILLVFLLLVTAGVYAHDAKPGQTSSITAVHTHTESSQYNKLHAANNELALSLSQLLSGSLEKVNVKKPSGNSTADRHFAIPVSYSNSYNGSEKGRFTRSVHLVLIFPSHYFW